MNGRDSALVSVIVPVYNSEYFLPRCIDSIITQSYKNLEILLIDDESTDRSPNICDEYARRDARIKVYHKKNSGTGPSRQFGLEHSMGEYIAFVDNDDLIDPKMYEKMVDAIQNNHADVCACLFNHVNADGQNEWSLDDLNPQILGLHDTVPFSRFYFQGGYNNGIVGSIWNKLFKRETLEGITMRNGRGEEEEVNDYVNRHNRKIIVIAGELYYWMENNASVSHKPFNEKNWQFLDVIAQRADWFSQDSIVRNESMKLYCNLYVEYYYKAKGNTQVPAAIKQQFRHFYGELIKSHYCEMKFYFRLLIFMSSPSLYGRITAQ